MPGPRPQYEITLTPEQEVRLHYLSTCYMAPFATVQRAQIVAESSVAGASVQSVAARHGIRAAKLSSWRRKPRAKSAKRTDKSVARFAAVRVESAVDGTIEIDLAKGCVRVLGTVSSVMFGSSTRASSKPTKSFGTLIDTDFH